ncbi:hypothetical protein [Anaerotruncus sp. DFI.9.16]|uniref:hypothetical protein n=1 Tax=Anaerotruncus sp. DFI.9.16 TaxID=2965275 RepID=UPI00210EF7E6|nr:hypothetical protein [Anaerotruncus sp. DFI.9.16]
MEATSTGRMGCAAARPTEAARTRRASPTCGTGRTSWRKSARYLCGANLIAREQDGALQYYLHNAHGDVAQRTDALGNLLKNYRYDAFGNEEHPEPLDVNPQWRC